MPSTSQAQHDLMRAVVAGKSNAVSINVAREFLAADKAAGKFQGKKASDDAEPQSKKRDRQQLSEVKRRMNKK